MNKIIVEPPGVGLEECPVDWCEGHLLEGAAPDDLMHTGRTIRVELPVGRATGALIGSPPAYFRVTRNESVDDGNGLFIDLRLDTLIAPFELRDFTQAFRDFAAYLDIKSTILLGVRS